MVNKKKYKTQCSSVKSTTDDDSNKKTNEVTIQQTIFGTPR